MPRQFEEFWASPSAELHMLDRHGLTLDEVLEAAYSSSVYQPAKSESPESLNPTGERRYMLAGRTMSGKRLWIVFADEGGGVGRIITAREVRGQAEQTRHRRLRGD